MHGNGANKQIAGAEPGDGGKTSQLMPSWVFTLASFGSKAGLPAVSLITFMFLSTQFVGAAAFPGRFTSSPFEASELFPSNKFCFCFCLDTFTAVFAFCECKGKLVLFPFIDRRVYVRGQTAAYKNVSRQNSVVSQLTSAQGSVTLSQLAFRGESDPTSPKRHSQFEQSGTQNEAVPVRSSGL